MAMSAESSESLPDSSVSSSESEPEIPFRTPWRKSDVVFVVEGSEIHVHRSILAMQSEVFKGMLTTEASQEKIELEGKTYEDMLGFLKMLYPPYMVKRSPDTRQNNLKILALADEYETRDLIEPLFAGLKITPSNALKVLPFGTKYNQNVRQKCIEITQASVSTKDLKKRITTMDSELVQEILLRKCEILENIVKQAQMCLTAIIGTKVWSGKLKDNVCIGGSHTVRVDNFHQAKKCVYCLKFYEDNFCKLSNFKQVFPRPPLLELLKSMDTVLDNK